MEHLDGRKQTELETWKDQWYWSRAPLPLLPYQGLFRREEIQVQSGQSSPDIALSGSPSSHPVLSFLDVLYTDCPVMGGSLCV